MGELIAKERTIVVPGQVIAKGMDFLPSNGTYRKGEDVIANRLGMLNVEGKVLKTTQISGRYIPQQGDTIIGKVEDILMSGWRLDINSPYSAVLPLKDASFDYIAKGADLTKYFRLEDFAVAKITNVTSQNLVDITVKGPGLKRLRGGRIIKVSPHKVPRIIGKKGSMVSMMKKATDCKIIVGQNGLVWLEGEPGMEAITVQAIKKIEREAHISGLTDRVKKFLEEKTGKTINLEELQNTNNNHNTEEGETQ
ncbi:exosome complex protein Rrp4 [Candidatus Woesearchaeota archaeon]|nr:exosome complex protein Rrp4 [Candidatus Woesearchaeota archaeon]MCF7901327.1 exosome complex protein Rrp4 [Candidatus Woesearchaeota archaeon]MCF8014001.1 exosome complex protein Rrp4 [Candidatus Woesearchaeota archaeon]